MKSFVCYNHPTSVFLTETAVPVCQVSQDDCTADFCNVGSSLWLSSVVVGVNAGIRVSVVCCWQKKQEFWIICWEPFQDVRQTQQHLLCRWVEFVLLHILLHKHTEGVFLFPSRCKTLMCDCFLLSQSVTSSQTHIRGPEKNRAGVFRFRWTSY